MMFRQVLVIIVLVAISNIEGRAYRRTFHSANPWLRALDEFRRNAAQKQDCKVDLGLVMDNTKGDFGLIKDFARHLVSKFQISDGGTHVGAITFGKTANIRLLFNDLQGSENSLEGLNKKIDAWPADDISNTSDITEALIIADDFLFVKQNGMRSDVIGMTSGVKQVLVLFTDGKQSDSSTDPADITANRLRTAKGIKIISVGIGIPDPIELWKIAGRSFSDVHLLSDVDKIESIAEGIDKSVCNEA